MPKKPTTQESFFLIQWRSNATDGSLTGFLSKIYYGLCVFIIFTANLILASRGALFGNVCFCCFGFGIIVGLSFSQKVFFQLADFVRIGFGALEIFS